MKGEPTKYTWKNKSRQTLKMVKENRFNVINNMFKFPEGIQKVKAFCHSSATAPTMTFIINQQQNYFFSKLKKQVMFCLLWKIFGSK